MEKKRPAKHKPTKQIGKALTAQTNQLEIDVNEWYIAVCSFEKEKTAKRMSL